MHVTYKKIIASRNHLETTRDGNYHLTDSKVWLEEEQINSALKDILVNSYKEVFDTSQKYGIRDLRTAAMALSVKRVAKAIELRGIFP